jgi:hypothetical protein
MAKKKLANDGDGELTIEVETPEPESEPPAVVPKYGEHILIDFGGTGLYDIRPAPEGWKNDRVVHVDGANCEHVGEGGDQEPWKYRRM